MFTFLLVLLLQGLAYVGLGCGGDVVALLGRGAGAKRGETVWTYIFLAVGGGDWD